ncbi:MAG: 50S ribosomal protein L21 [Planctomycetales bacterium]|nr:50S ribosomal protein L21 [Planctomycetales bacterium]
MAAAAPKTPRTYAVFEDRGHRHRVAAGDRLLLAHLPGASGSEVRFEKVLLLGGGKAGAVPRVGKPTVAGASVLGVIEGEVKGEKLKIYKWRRRENYHRRIGHRQKYTQVRIAKILQ